MGNGNYGAGYGSEPGLGTELGKRRASRIHSLGGWFWKGFGLGWVWEKASDMMKELYPFLGDVSGGRNR